MEWLKGHQLAECGVVCTIHRKFPAFYRRIGLLKVYPLAQEEVLAAGPSTFGLDHELVIAKRLCGTCVLTLRPTVPLLHPGGGGIVKREGDCQQGTSLIKVSKPDNVDLVLAEISIALPNLDCEEILPDDICFDLLEQVDQDRDLEGGEFDIDASEAARVYAEVCGSDESDQFDPDIDSGAPPDPITCEGVMPDIPDENSDTTVDQICSQGTQDYCAENLRAAVEFAQSGGINANSSEIYNYFQAYYECMGELSGCYQLFQGPSDDLDYFRCALDENGLTIDLSATLPPSGLTCDQLRGKIDNAEDPDGMYAAEFEQYCL